MSSCLQICKPFEVRIGILQRKPGLYNPSYHCRFPRLASHAGRAHLAVYELSHSDCAAVCLTKRFISYASATETVIVVRRQCRGIVNTCGSVEFWARLSGVRPGSAAGNDEGVCRRWHLQLYGNEEWPERSEVCSGQEALQRSDVAVDLYLFGWSGGPTTGAADRMRWRSPRRRPGQKLGSGEWSRFRRGQSIGLRCRWYAGRWFEPGRSGRGRDLEVPRRGIRRPRRLRGSVLWARWVQ